MYMTRIALRRLPAPNTIHGLMSAAFPGKRNETKNENLWRTDDLGNLYALIIVSADMPEIKKIVGMIGADKLNLPDGNENNKPNKTVDYEPFLNNIKNGQIWNFRLRANPIEHKKQNNTDKRGKIFAFIKVEDQIEWLKKQGIKNGFILNSCYVLNDSWIEFEKVCILSVTFEGILTITDEHAFKKVLTDGVGRGKAYGCGLLTVAAVT